MVDALPSNIAQSAPVCILEDHSYETLFDRAMDGIFQTDQQGYYLRCNPALAQIYGYESTEALIIAQPIVNGKFYVNATHHEVIIEQVAQEGRVSNYEFQAYRRDGSIIWISVTCWSLYDNDGNLACYEGFVKDTTESKVVEATLRYNEQQSKAIVTAIPDLMFRVSRDGIYQGYVNTNHFIDLLPDDYEPIGQPLSQYLPAEVAERHLKHLNQAMATGNIQIYEQQHELNGRPQAEEVRVVPIDEHGVLFIVRDVTQQKQAEEDLRQRNQELRSALQQLQKAQAELIQADKMVVLGQLIAGIAHEVNTPLGAIQASSGNVLSALEAFLPKLPELFELAESGQIQLIFDLIERALNETTITTAREKRKQRRLLSRQLEAADVPHAASLADTLVDMGVSDAIEPYLTLLKSPNGLPMVDLAYDLVRIRSNSQTIQMAVKRAASVVGALKNFARQDHSGQKTTVQVTDSIDTVLTLYRNQLKQGIEVTRNYEDLPSMPCYPDELSQIWTNLLQNAIQAMAGKGEIVITAQRRSSNKASYSGDCLVVSVTDNGPGIPPEVMSRVFDPFFTTKPIGEGTGLGLNISRKIVKKHDGWLDIDSKPGRTCFEVWLPMEITHNV